MYGKYKFSYLYRVDASHIPLQSIQTPCSDDVHMPSTTTLDRGVRVKKTHRLRHSCGLPQIPVAHHIECVDGGDQRHDGSGLDSSDAGLARLQVPQPPGLGKETVSEGLGLPKVETLRQALMAALGIRFSMSKTVPGHGYGQAKKGRDLHRPEPK